MAVDTAGLLAFRLARRQRAWLVRYGLPLLGGVGVAVFTTLVTNRLSPVWIFLVSVGLVALLPAFLVSDARKYWIGLFLAVLPLNITKIFMTEERARLLIDQVGSLWGNPAPILQLADFPLAALGSVWLLRVAARRERFVLPGIARWALAYLVWVTAGALFAPYPWLAVEEVVREYKLFLVFLVAVNVVDARKMSALVLSLVLAGAALQGAITLVRYQAQSTARLFGDAFGSYEDPWVSRVTGDEDESAKIRGFGTLRHPNVTAMHLSMTLPMAAATLLAARRTAARWATAVVLLLGLGGLYATFSRGGMIGVLVGLAVVLVAAVAKSRARTWVLTVAAAGMLMLVLTAFLLLPRYLDTRPEYSTLHFGMIETGLKMAGINPVMGTGLNNSTPFRVHFSDETQDELLFPVHNYHLLILIETGFVGFALYYAFFGGILWKSVRLGGSADPDTMALALGVAGAYVGLGVQLMVDYVNLDALQMLIWFFAGLVIALGRAEAERAAATAALPASAAAPPSA